MFKKLRPITIYDIIYIVIVIILALNIYMPKMLSSQIDKSYIRSIDTEQIHRYFTNEEYLNIQNAEIDTQSSINNSRVANIYTDTYSMFVMNPHPDNNYICVYFSKKTDVSDITIQINVLFDDEYSDPVKIKKSAYSNNYFSDISTNVDICKDNIRIKIDESTIVKRSKMAQAFLEEIINDMLI